jgi:hypothetical protein
MFCQNLHLKIDGTNKFETLVIDSLNYKQTHINYLSVLNEIDSIQNKLYKKGYLENEVGNIKRENDTILSTVFKLNKKYSKITIYYNDADLDAEVLKFISKEITKTYFKLDFNSIENALKYINKENSKNGFPFAKLVLSEVKINKDSSLSANLVVNKSNRKRIINDIVLKGYENFPKSYLKHYLKIKKGQSLDLATIKRKTDELNNLRFASEVKSPEVLFSKDSSAIYLYVQKEKSNLFDGFLGFGTNEDNNNLQFDGYLNLSLTNNLNYGESFKLIYKSDENDQKNFEANVSLPYLFKSPIGLDLSLRIFKRDSSFTTVNQSAKLHYQINSKHKLYAGLISTESNNLLSINNSNSISDYKTNYYSFAYEFLKFQIQNPLFPVNSKLYFETDFGNRIQSNNREKQTFLSIDAFKIFNFNTNNSIYVRVNSSKLNSKTYYENELLRFGGINSIRGFEENSIYSTFFGVINSEYRYQLTNSIYINSISDFAYYENKLTNSKEKLYGFGFGFGILTNAGLLKLNYANGKNENNKIKLANSKVHISLLANF